MKRRGREGVRLGLRVKWGISRGDGGRGRSLNIVLINPTRDYVFLFASILIILVRLAKIFRRYLRKLLRNQRNVLHEKYIDILEEEKFK